MSTTHYRTCHLCEALCGLAIEHEGDRILSIRGDAEDPFSAGHICPKGAALQDLHEDPDRLRRPLRRRGDGWEEIGWKEAFDEVGRRLRTVQREYGRDAVAWFQGNPFGHNLGCITHGLQFAMNLGTRNRYSSASMDELPRRFASLQMYGHQAVIPVPDIDRTSHLLVLGANPLASNGSVMSAPDVAGRLRSIGERGGKVVLVDPRRNETARIADEHHFIRPGTDAFLLLAMLHVLFRDGLVSPPPHLPLRGMEEIERVASAINPEDAAARTGLDADTIARLARELAAAPTAICYGRIGVSIQEFGALCTWLIDLINIVTGNFDRPGGVMFTTPAVDLVKLLARMGERGHFGLHRSRVRGLPEFSGELPSAVLPEEIETPGQGQVRALITCAANPVLSATNGPRLERALARLDFMVAIDVFVNETTRHADIILPPTFGVENVHYDTVFNLVSIRNTARFSHGMCEPGPDTRRDWEIFTALMARIGGNPIKRWATSAALRLLPPARMVNLLLRLGPHGDRFNPFSQGLSLAKLKHHPHGLDLGPLQSRIPDLLYTEDRTVHLAPQLLIDDVDRLRRQAPASPEGLSLIGRRDLRSNNSWMHNAPRLMKGRPRCTLHMHPDDAAARSLRDGLDVVVTSRVGSVRVPVQVTDTVMRGVVSLPHGWGHHRPGTRLSVAAETPGVSFNDLSDEERLDGLVGTGAVNGIPVEVAVAPAVDSSAAATTGTGAPLLESP